MNERLEADVLLLRKRSWERAGREIRLQRIKNAAVVLAAPAVLAIIPLTKAVLCVNCSVISDVRTDRCPACGADGGMLSLARVLNPCPEIGTVTWLYAGVDDDNC